MLGILELQLLQPAGTTMYAQAPRSRQLRLAIGEIETAAAQIEARLKK
jgi:hypothetical protein